jgi:hypothetical protein
VLGTNLYDYFGGFTVCVIAITVVYALILPVLLLVPKRLIETAHGQTPEVAFTADDRQKICGPIYRPLGQQGLYNL